MSRGLLTGWVLLMLGALALRLPQLDQRPMHTDESVHAIKFRGLWEQGVYRYDPNEFHGPTLYYATLPIAWLSPAHRFAELTEKELRLVPALFGVGLILLLLLAGRMLGGAAVWAAGVFTAVSPAMVFYSRYYIHEMLLVFFTFLLIAALWRYGRTRRVRWMLLAGGALGLMHATKETFVFNLVAMVGAIILTMVWSRWVVPAETGVALGRVPTRHLAAGVVVAVVVSVLFFTSFFTNAQGPIDSLRTYLPWLSRAQGESPHVHPWHYYLGLLAWHHPDRGPVWTEGVILVLALVGAVAALIRQGLPQAHIGWVRFVAFYTVLLTALYCVIPYKTPWCALGFLHGMILLAGVGAVTLVRLVDSRVYRVAALLVLGLGTAHLTAQAWRASFKMADRPENPYVYAHTLGDILNLARQVEQIAAADPEGHSMLVQVIATGGDYWPLPWYLRRFEKVGWYTRPPEKLTGKIIIAGGRPSREIDPRIKESHAWVGFFGLRPNVFLVLYVEKETWARFQAAVASRPDTSSPDRGP